MIPMLVGLCLSVGASGQSTETHKEAKSTSQAAGIKRRFRYYGDQIVCEACEERNPQSRRRLLPRVLLQPRSILVNFVAGRSLAAQAMSLDHRTMLGPQVSVQSGATLRRLLGYLGGTPEQLADFDSSHRRWGQGTVQITLQPGRKNLLRIDHYLL
jgi:hypothetical protein